MSTLKTRRIAALVTLFALASTAIFAQGGTWTARTVPPNTPDLYSVHFFNGRIGLVAGEKNGVGVVHRTTDSGATWTANLVPSAPPINDLQFIEGTRFGYVTGDANFFAVSSDSGKTWVQRSLPPSLWTSPSDLQAVHFKSPGRGFVVGLISGATGPRMAQTGDTGRTWTVVPLSGTPANNLYDIDFFDFLHGVVVGTGLPTRKSVTTDGGLTWEGNANMGTQPQTESVSMYGLDAVQGMGTAYAVGGKNYASPRYALVRKTVDTGKTWTTIDFSGAGFTQPASDVLALGDQVLFVSGQNGAIARSLDAGATWVRDAVPSSVGTNDLRKFSSTGDNFLFVVGTSGHVLRTRVVPDVRYPTDSIDFGKHCPGSGAERTVQIGNAGNGMLTITGFSITEPPNTNIWFEVIPPAPTSIAPRTSGAFHIRVSVPPGTPGGIHIGELRMGNNDDNGASRDTFFIVYLKITVSSTAIVGDSSIPRFAGRFRVGRTTILSLPGHLRNSSDSCAVHIDTAYFVSRRPFELLNTISDTTLQPAGRHDVRVRFTVDSVCERTDTLLVFHDGEDSPSRLAFSGIGIEPSFSTNPEDTLTLPGTLVGRATTGVLELLNRRDGACLDSTGLRSFAVMGPNASEFTVAPTFVPARTWIPADSLLRLTVTATPGGLGRRMAFAVIGHEISPKPDTVVLVTEGLDAELAPLPDEILFPVTDVGWAQDTILPNALRNLGGSPLSFTSVVVAGGDSAMFSALAPIPPGTIPGDAEDTLAVRFLPTRPGTFASTLRIRTSAGKTIEVRIRGESDYARASLAPDSVDFGRVPILGCRDTVVGGWLINSGRVPLRVRALTTEVHPGGAPTDLLRFSAVDPALTVPLAVAPGDSVLARLRFCPVAPGEHVALLRASTNVPGDSLVGVLRGEAYEARIALIDTIIFPLTSVGSTSDTVLGSLIVNRETTSFTVDTLRIAGPDDLDFVSIHPSLPRTIASGDTLGTTLRFAPALRGAREGRLMIESSLGTQAIVLLGAGVGPELEFSQDRTQPVRTRVGTTLPMREVARNVGETAAHIHEVTLTGASAFRLTSTPTLPVTIAPGDSVEFLLEFSPDATCDHQASLFLRCDGIRGSVLTADTTIPLLGIGTAPAIFTSDSVIDFGVRVQGSSGDSVVTSFVWNGRSGDPAIRCVDSTRVDSVVVTGRDADVFSLIAPTPAGRTVLPTASLDVGLRLDTRNTGSFEATLLLYFDGSTDSTRVIPVRAVVQPPPSIRLSLDLGSDMESEPGAVIRVPISIKGDLSAAAIDTMRLRLSFHRSLLEPIAVRTSAGIAAIEYGPNLDQDRATMAMDLFGNAPLTAGRLGEVEFRVMLGKVLSSHVTVDSAWSEGRSDVMIAPDTAIVSIEEFCDAEQRRIRFAGSELLRITPNPADEDAVIDYLIVTGEATRLQIIDASGREIVSLVDGIRLPGAYSMKISVAGLSHGMYYVQLCTGRFVETKELRVLR